MSPPAIPPFSKKCIRRQHIVTSQKKEGRDFGRLVTTGHLSFLQEWHLPPAPIERETSSVEGIVEGGPRAPLREGRGHRRRTAPSNEGQAFLRRVAPSRETKGLADRGLRASLTESQGLFRRRAPLREGRGIHRGNVPPREDRRLCQRRA